MYGYDYAPATEGIGSWFKNIVETVGRKIREVTEFLRKHITELGKKIKLGKQYFPTTDKNALKIIHGLFTKTHSIIFCCSDIIDEMYVDYLSIGKVEISNKQYQSHYLDDGDTFHIYDAPKQEVRKETYKNNNYETRSFKLEPGKMQKGDNTSDEDWNKFQNKIGELFESMHEKVDELKQDLTELQNMPPLSYNTTLRGYEELKRLYDANIMYGRYWDKLKTAHEFADPNGRIKKALSKVVSMYNVGVNAAKAFAVRLNTGNFKNADGKKYRKGDEIYNKAKDEVKNIGEFVDTRTPENSEYDYEHFRPFSDKGYKNMEKQYNYKGKYKDVKYTKESATLTRLYDMAYEDAMHDLEMKAEYIKAFESVPDAFDEFI